MQATWVVVAESARARIFFLPEAGGKVTEVADLSHPEARLHDTELASDAPGRSFDSHGQGRHGMEPPTAPKDREAQLFAGEIARFVDEGLNEGRFESLVLMAPPKFLGLLRRALGSAARRSVAAEIDKNRLGADEETISREASALLR